MKNWIWMVTILMMAGCTAQNPLYYVETVAAGDMEEADFVEIPQDNVDMASHLADIAQVPDLLSPSPPSCANLPKTCGPNQNEDCCTSLPVPEGTFFRSYDGTTDYNDKSNPATISNFKLDKFEVTIGRFRTFVNAGMGTRMEPPAAGTGAHPKIPESGWKTAWNTNLMSDTAALKAALKCDSNHQTWTDQAGPNENLPVNCVDWFEAFAFCAWDGGRLPTEAEWNYAAAGGAEQRVYPWSNPPGATMIDDTFAVYCGGTCAIQNVGSRSPKGDGKWGHADLAGNVWEWVLDGYATYTNPCVDCAIMNVNSNTILRGGSTNHPDVHLRASYRVSDAAPNNRAFDIGIRCARQ